MPMLYDIKLQIGSTYDHPVATGRHVLRVSPMKIAGRQTLRDLRIEIDPAPESRRTFLSYFGAENLSFAIRHPHEALSVTLGARVEVTTPQWLIERSASREALREALVGLAEVGPGSPHHVMGPSPRLPPAGAAIADYTRESVGQGRTVAEIALDLMRRIKDDFVYDPAATSVDTSAADAFALRRGVCQDFTHIMISGLRALAIPAAYVSGYLRTLPPPGKPKLVGADAMHAWVRAWCGPGCGWIEFDPTNAMLAGADHIVAGLGRDYADVAPLAGTFKGHGGQKGFQRVDIGVAGAGTDGFFDRDGDAIGSIVR